MCFSISYRSGFASQVMTRKKLIPKPRRTIKAKRTKIFSYLQKVNCKKNGTSPRMKHFSFTPLSGACSTKFSISEGGIVFFV